MDLVQKKLAERESMILSEMDQLSTNLPEYKELSKRLADTDSLRLASEQLELEKAKFSQQKEKDNREVQLAMMEMETKLQELKLKRWQLGLTGGAFVLGLAAAWMNNRMIVKGEEEHIINRKNLMDIKLPSIKGLWL